MERRSNNGHHHPTPLVGNLVVSHTNRFGVLGFFICIVSVSSRTSSSYRKGTQSNCTRPSRRDRVYTFQYFVVQCRGTKLYEWTSREEQGCTRENILEHFRNDGKHERHCLDHQSR